MARRTVFGGGLVLLAIGAGIALFVEDTRGPGNAVVAAGVQPAATATATSPVVPDPVQLERGRVVYAEQKCQACHSIGGVGNRRYPLDGVGSKLPAADLRKWIVSPREMNPRVSKRAFDKLPPADLEALVAYVSSLRKS